MNNKQLILLGGGGHCRAVIEVIKSLKETSPFVGEWEIAGILDVAEKIDEDIEGINIIGTEQDIRILKRFYSQFLITVGQIKTAEPRKKLVHELGNVIFPIILSPKAVISKQAKIDIGTVILHLASINAGAQIGKHCIINTGTIIEHDAIIGDFCHISTGAIINGGAKIGQGTFVGSNAVIAHNVKIGEECIISSGTRILNDIMDKKTIKENS